MAEYTIQETIGFSEARRLATDAEICEQFPHHVLFSVKGGARVNVKAAVTVRLQVMSLPLADDTRRPIHRKRSIMVVSDEEPFIVETDDKGYGEFECVFVATGRYTFTTDGVIYSDGITLEAV